jgi:hypothetical protein
LGWLFISSHSLKGLLLGILIARKKGLGFERFKSIRSVPIHPMMTMMNNFMARDAVTKLVTVTARELVRMGSVDVTKVSTQEREREREGDRERQRDTRRTEGECVCLMFIAAKQEAEEALKTMWQPKAGYAGSYGLPNETTDKAKAHWTKNARVSPNSASSDGKVKTEGVPNIWLDDTFSVKAMTHLLEALTNDIPEDEPVVFWSTKSLVQPMHNAPEAMFSKVCMIVCSLAILFNVEPVLSFCGFNRWMSIRIGMC